jgi:hypothetical protein
VKLSPICAVYGVYKADIPSAVVFGSIGAGVGGVILCIMWACRVRRRKRVMRYQGQGGYQ